MTLQAEYLAARDSKALHDELFQAIYDMAEIQVKSILGKRKISMSRYRIKTIAADASAMIMARYNKPGWMVRAHYIKEIQITCAHFMFDKRYKDRLQYGPMAEAVCSTWDKSAEKARCIAQIQLASIYSEGIIKEAQGKKYSKYLAYICARHSIAWVESHMGDLKALWDAYHA